MAHNESIPGIEGVQDQAQDPDFTPIVSKTGPAPLPLRVDYVSPAEREPATSRRELPLHLSGMVREAAKVVTHENDQPSDYEQPALFNPKV